MACGATVLRDKRAPVKAREKSPRPVPIEVVAAAFQLIRPLRAARVVPTAIVAPIANSARTNEEIGGVCATLRSVV
jgi:hypothetical protein